MRYVIGLDIGVKHDATVAAICHAEHVPGQEHPRVVLDRMQVWTPSRLRPVRLQVVEEWVEEAARRYNRARVRFDPYQALHIAQRLKRRGITVQEFTFSASSVGKLATTLLQLIRERSLALPDDPELLDELRNVRLKETSPGVFRLDHDPADTTTGRSPWLSLLPARRTRRHEQRENLVELPADGSETLVDRRRRAHGRPRARNRKA